MRVLWHRGILGKDGPTPQNNHAYVQGHCKSFCQQSTAPCHSHSIWIWTRHHWEQAPQQCYWQGLALRFTRGRGHRHEHKHSVSGLQFRGSDSKLPKKQNQPIHRSHARLCEPPVLTALTCALLPIRRALQLRHTSPMRPYLQNRPQLVAPWRRTHIQAGNVDIRFD